MTKAELIQQIRLKKSFLCLGLDPDLDKLPPHLLETEDPIFARYKPSENIRIQNGYAFNPITQFLEIDMSEIEDIMREYSDFNLQKHTIIDSIKLNNKLLLENIDKLQFSVIHKLLIKHKE